MKSIRGGEEWHTYFRSWSYSICITSVALHDCDSDKQSHQNMAKGLLLSCMPLFFTISLVLASPQYDIEASKEYVKMAAVAFCPKKCIDQWNCTTTSSVPLRNTFYAKHPITLAAGYLGYHPTRNQIILAFRGSCNTPNWIQDFNTEQLDYSPCKGCRIHTGFYLDYKLIQRQFEAHLKKLLLAYPTASILATGHSLGAALSLVCALQIKDRHPNKQVSVHNFGQPRMGNDKLAIYASQVLKSIYRVVHNKDIAPHIPKGWVLAHYHHPGREVFFNEEMTEYRVCDASGEDPGCSNKFDPNFEWSQHDFYFMHISQVQC